MSPNNCMQMSNSMYCLFKSKHFSQILACITTHQHFFKMPDL